MSRFFLRGYLRSGRSGSKSIFSRIGRRHLVSVKKSAKFKSGLFLIPISPEDFISSNCHVYTKEGASIPKCEKVVVSALYN